MDISFGVHNILALAMSSLLSFVNESQEFSGVM